jgi:hypothetical protein
MKARTFLLIMLLHGISAWATEDFWEYHATLNGPPGRIVLSIAGSQGYLFAGTADGDIYRSTDIFLFLLKDYYLLPLPTPAYTDLKIREKPGNR